MSPTNRPSIAPELIEELREDFAEVDDNQDGLIDFAEFCNLMENLEARMTQTDLGIGFREIDTDHDGRINAAEFIAWRSGR
jgi:Ca2+-binding EF-hand superfamily protein